MNGKRAIVTPIRTIRDAFVDKIRVIVPEVDSRGIVGYWTGYTMDVVQSRTGWRRAERKRRV